MSILQPAKQAVFSTFSRCDSDYNKLISRENSSVDKLPSVQTVFKADAIVNGKKTDAVIINLIIHYEPQARFYILSYSVLQKDMNKFAVIYKRARDSFKVLE